ncbi:xanthine dehydrogenase family protein molybdopterin-binding subunit [Nocardioides sp. J2M5]|uniref:molybdopterin cofactor-binding domain-containing protein n=1 Tax=Nocardioides palaemonis TaxID=2829810 RepID=UPI001BAC51BA|nr:molybdopterin cofactor-binding domain-containing protein [Nocardioides palaemonis]MBS2936347.1 xanthine dehydrogenase family protein molybdopterin-binding subunit [Nocardioides palaemonis]
MTPSLDPCASTAEPVSPYAVDRRRFVGYVVAGATLAAAADLGLASAPADAAVPTLPQVPELYDLNDMLTDAARPTANLITVVVHEDGTASLELPRMEVGQGITTSTAMLIAEELDLPVDRVTVTLAPARPELLFNQLTGGSNTTISTYTPVRVAAAVARLALLEAAAVALGDTVAGLVAKGGVVTAASGASITYGELAVKASVSRPRSVEVELKSTRDFSVVGTPTNRVDALAAVTGQKDFTTDLDVPGALPTMVCRAPTLNGTPVAIRNRAAVEAMPGVTHVAQVSTGVAVRAATFGQCIDAVRALDVQWKDGPVAGESDATILRKVRRAQLPMPRLPDTPLARTVSGDFTFWFRSNSAMDTNSAIADVRPDRAEIWSGLKSPIVAQQQIALRLGMRPDQVKVNVVTAGGSFGRRLFFDAALEAAEISQAMGAPVKLMWHRADDARVGRAHPLGTCRVQATVLGQQVLAFHQSLTCVETDFRHGLGEIITAAAADLPAGVGNLGFAETIFALTQEVPYDFGAVVQTLVETDDRFNTGSMRNIYSPDVRVASELVVDQIAATMRMDPYRFRRKFQRNPRVLKVLDAVASAGEWGRPMPAGTAQGIAVHKEYKGVSACLVEIDTRPGTTGRQVRDAVTGPRVTRVTFAIDAGLVINPRGLEAQMQGGINDGIALALTSSLHLRDGHFLEASWDNYFYTRQWNTPPDVRVIVVPSDEPLPGGAGEAGVAASFAAVACAYARATGRMPTEFPINHQQLSFEPKSFVPPIPASPTNGLDLIS